MDEPRTKPALDRLMEAHARALSRVEKGRPPKWQMRLSFAEIRAALQVVFGSSSSIVSTCSDRIIDLEHDRLSADDFARDIQQLSGLISSLERIGGASILNATSYPSPAPAGNHVFIVHGHDELNTHRLKTVLQEHFALSAVMILTRPGMSRPLIDKFEDHAVRCCYAIVLYTPDDSIAGDRDTYHQARPNVLFEAGWFVGRLGRDRVLLLVKQGTRIHSDLDGVSRIQFRDSVDEKVVEIARELKAVRLI